MAPHGLMKLIADLARVVWSYVAQLTRDDTYIEGKLISSHCQLRPISNHPKQGDRRTGIRLFLNRNLSIRNDSMRVDLVVRYFNNALKTVPSPS